MSLKIINHDVTAQYRSRITRTKSDGFSQKPEESTRRSATARNRTKSSVCETQSFGRVSSYKRNKARVSPDKLTGSWVHAGGGTGKGKGLAEKRGVRSRRGGGGAGGAQGRTAKGAPFRESTRTIIRSRAGSSKDPRDDISMPCLRNNFNYPRYTKKNTKSNARNSDERAPAPSRPSHSPL